MNKAILSTLILAVTVVTVLAELVANNYVESGSLSGNIFGATDPNSIFEVTEADNSDVKSAAQDIELPSEVAELPKPKSIVETALPSNPTVGIEELREAGFFDPYISPVSAHEKVFGVLEIPEQFGDRLVQSQIMEDSSSVGIVQEYHLSDSIEALELYNSIKFNGQEANFFDVNEVGNYGDGSFYLNHVVNTDQVFIVVRTDNVIWAFTYVKVLHPKFKELLGRLSFV